MISGYPGSGYPGFYGVTIPVVEEGFEGVGGATWDTSAAGTALVVPKPEGGVGLGGGGRRKAPAYLFRRPVWRIVRVGSGGAAWYGDAVGVANVETSFDDFFAREIRLFAALDALDSLDHLDEVLHSIAMLGEIDGP
jgi:hypothetical protein